MWFGTKVDEETSFAILDRFADSGGTLVDTANNYAFWLDNGVGGESEEVTGRWLASRRVRDQMVIGTKVGGLPGERGDGPEGLSPAAIRNGLDDSLRRLRTDHVDVYWAHIEDRATPLADTVAAFADAVDAGKVRMLGASNHATWAVERARTMAAAGGRSGYSNLQLRYSYLQPRVHAPLPRQGHLHVTEETLDYVRSESDISLWTYNSLLAGAYVRSDKPIQQAYEHPGTAARLAVLREIVDETGASANQVVLAWMLRTPKLIPITGVSTVAQLDDLLGAYDVELTDEHVKRLEFADSCALPG